MINELYRLSETLIGAEIPLEADHNLRRNLPNGDCFRIWLDNNGSVSDVELLPVDLTKSLSKFGDNQSTFPAFNIAPLYRVSATKDKELFDNIQNGKANPDSEILKSICVFDNWGKKRINQVNACLHKRFPAQSDCGIFSELLNLCGSTNAKTFRAELEQWVWNKLLKKEDINVCLAILIYKGNPQKDNSSEDDCGSLSIMLDLQNWEKYGRPVASESTSNQINKALLEADQSASIDAPLTDTYDAFGSEYADVGKPMPSVRIVAGFDVALRGMFSEQRCQFRYNNADDASYPITPRNRMRTQAALKWIADPKHENAMWKIIDGEAILLVYPDKLPDIIPKYATLFASAKTDTAARFEDVSKGFIKTLSGIPPDKRPEQIQVFTLRQIPPALSKRARVDLSQSLTVAALVQSAGDWQCGFKNIPELDRVNSDVLFPLEVYKTINQVWKMDGETKKSVPQMRYYQGIELLLNVMRKSQIEYHLRGLLANCAGLVIYMGNKLSKERRGKLSIKHKGAVSKFLPLVGMLLYKLGCKKEDYMESYAFLLGRVLKLSDSLHALYCEKKRDGEIPAQLVGNALFVTASENPDQALALLGTRMCPYIAWAKQSDDRLAWWHLKQFEDVMAKVGPKITAELRCTDFDKAQLFIGYLAKFPNMKDEARPDEELPTTNKEDKASE